jgi:hypothetical protein
MKISLLNFLNKKGGKINSGMSWKEILEELNIEPSKVNRKKASDIWRRREVESLYPNDLNNIDINNKKDGIYLSLGCVHAPFTNKVFWKAMLKMAKEHKDNIKGLIINGDFLDLHSLSAYDRGSIAIDGVTLSMEYEGGNAYLNSILNVLNKDVYKGFIYGNHEARYKKYMKNIDNSKLGSSLPSPETALKLVEKGFEVFTDWVNDEIVIGDLTIIHGEFCNVHVTKKYIDVFKKNFLFNHTHRVSMYREGEHVAYNAGTMGDLNSPIFNYATKAMKKTWSNAFAIITLNKGITSVELPVWNNDHFIYGGKIYK